MAKNTRFSRAVYFNARLGSTTRCRVVDPQPNLEKESFRNF